MAYASTIDLTRRYDERRVGQLILDNGEKATPAQITSSAVVSEILEDASSLVDAYALRGGKYTTTDLAGLTGSPQKFLKRLVCDLAYGLLVERRGFTETEARANAPGYARALGLLDKLAAGELIFTTDAAIAAGKPVRAVLDRRLQLISSATRLFGDLVVNPNNPGTVIWEP